MQEKLSIFQQVSSGLAALHYKDVLHRDLALRNVIIDRRSFVAKITDFGMSYNQSEYCKEEVENIAVAWSAPEFLETRVASTKSDMWR